MQAVLTNERRLAWPSEGPRSGGSEPHAKQPFDWDQLVKVSRAGSLQNNVRQVLEALQSAIERRPFDGIWEITEHLPLELPEMANFRASLVSEHKSGSNHDKRNVFLPRLSINFKPEGRHELEKVWSIPTGIYYLDDDTATPQLANKYESDLAECFVRSPYFKLMVEQLGPNMRIDEMEIYPDNGDGYTCDRSSSGTTRQIAAYRRFLVSDLDNLLTLKMEFTFSYVDPTRNAPKECL